MKPLSLRAEKFFTYYAITNNKRGSAIKAGYSPKGASSVARQLMLRPDAAKLVEEARKKASEQIEMTARDAVKIIEQIAKKEDKYKTAHDKDCLNAAVNIAKIKGVPGLADKIIIKEVPFQKWSREEILEFIRTGKVPDGREIPDLTGISQVLS